MGKKQNLRIEKDSLGTRSIPADVYYGIQTSRAIENFPISGLLAHPIFADAFMMIKKAAALTNRDCKVLDARRANAIARAADEVLAGKLRDQFVVDVFQMGAGTSFNMNCNEVLANRAEEILGGHRGEYKKIHPNDHANMSQSTNDCFPTAIRIAGLLALRKYLHPPLDALAKSLRRKAQQFKNIRKSGRTHLQDAIPIKLGQEFAAYAEAIEKAHASIHRASRSLYELGIGGTAVGTGTNTLKGYIPKIFQYIKRFSGLPLTASRDLREAMQSQRPIAEISAALRNLALEVSRIANDLRLLSSGPNTGLGEIVLPAVAPGSSIMPGKVNPSIPEMVNMVCFQVVGCDTTIALAVQAGQLELNVMMPLMAFNLLFAIQILGQALEQLRVKCIDGIVANERRCREYAESTVGLATLLNTYIGYSKAAEVAKVAVKSGKTILQVVREKKILPEKTIRQIFT